MEKRPPDLECSYQYIEYAVADSRQGVVCQIRVGEELKASHRKYYHMTKRLAGPRSWTDPLVRPKQWGRREVHAVWWTNLRAGDYLKDPSVDGRIILKWICERLDGCMDWINLAQDRDRWRDLVNVVMNFQVPENAGNFITIWGPVNF